MTAADARRAAAVCLAAALAVLAWHLHPVIAAGPALLGLPALLLLWAGRGGRNPYDVTRQYPRPPDE